MTNESEKARWAKLAGLPKKETKQQLDENVVGIGAVNQIFPTREPNDYEMAFEHFLGEMYDSKKENVEEESRSERADVDKYEYEKGKEAGEKLEEDAELEEMDLSDPMSGPGELDKIVHGDDAERDPMTGNIKEDEIEEVGFGKGSTDGTEGFGDMLYKGMDEMYKKHGKDMVEEIIEMYKKSETK